MELNLTVWVLVLWLGGIACMSDSITGGFRFYQAMLEPYSN